MQQQLLRREVVLVLSFVSLLCVRGFLGGGGASGGPKWRVPNGEAAGPAPKSAVVDPITCSRCGIPPSRSFSSRRARRRPALAMASTAGEERATPSPPPICWTIAGSDSGGGAGIQADLQAMHALGVHGCSVLTALTAQNSRAVTKVEYCSNDMIQATMDALREDLPPRVVKLGMLGRTDVMRKVTEGFLKDFAATNPITGGGEEEEGDGAGAGVRGKIVCDPVMVSTSGSSLMDEEAVQYMVENILPLAEVVTPNLHETEKLLGRSLDGASAEEMEEAALELLRRFSCKSLLIKGGHTTTTSGGEAGSSSSVAQDFWTDGTQKLWLTGPRVDNPNTHGTGCTLSSAIAACLAQGYDVPDALVIAKAYVSQGIEAATQLGAGPGPVAHTCWPCSPTVMPWITRSSKAGVAVVGGDGGGGVAGRLAFAPCHTEWGLYPIVETAEWVGRLAKMGVRDIQLRIKGASDEEVSREVGKAQALIDEHAAAAEGESRLWVNDFWRAAVEHGTYGVHIGQEDLQKAIEEEQEKGEEGNALSVLAAAGIRLGLSTHTYAELATALALRPSYISLGPVFATQSKQVGFAPQGLLQLKRWRGLVGVPLIAIGGITLERAPGVVEAGADGVAVINAITKHGQDDEAVLEAVQEWQETLVAAAAAAAAVGGTG